MKLRSFRVRVPWTDDGWYVNLTAEEARRWTERFLGYTPAFIEKVRGYCK